MQRGMYVALSSTRGLIRVWTTSDIKARRLIEDVFSISGKEDIKWIQYESKKEIGNYITNDFRMMAIHMWIYTWKNKKLVYSGKKKDIMSDEHLFDIAEKVDCDIVFLLNIGILTPGREECSKIIYIESESKENALKRLFKWITNDATDEELIDVAEKISNNHYNSFTLPFYEMDDFNEILVDYSPLDIARMTKHDRFDFNDEYFRVTDKVTDGVTDKVIVTTDRGTVCDWIAVHAKLQLAQSILDTDMSTYCIPESLENILKEYKEAIENDC